ncbi:putative glyoxalase superfamily protein PhnB [Knoellia remsis]|uniref:Putative glyoxalase superfamily protein PhnB n=2 Tax=Knoellia remsis TaxID=407159 RepID=A0A2T0UN95_9MICO|nr:putative glyoxalase superfamily protein PhnB [Knoellia remsis]
MNRSHWICSALEGVGCSGMSESLRVEFFPADLERSIAFYEALGFEVRGRSSDPVPYAAVRLGGVRIGLAQRPAVDPALRAVPIGTEVVIEVADVVACRDGVVAAGIELAGDLVEREWGLTDFRVTDPDGYYLRFTSRR